MRCLAWLGAGVVAWWGGGAAWGQATTNEVTRAKPAARVERAAADLKAWWNDAVFYEVFVRSFADSASGARAGDGVGDLRGLIERLDYLNDGKADGSSLGVTALWLMPIMQSPSYHGYDISDYTKVNEAYGTDADYRELVSECGKRGIRVILDLVPNHCSWECAWFKDAAAPGSATRDWFIWSEKDPGWKGPWNQRVWHPWPAKGAERGSSGYYYGLFSSVMPDLNFRNPAVTRAMDEVVKHWLEMGTAGFRVDAIRHLIEEGQQQESTAATHEWLVNFRTFYKGVKADAFTVGEVWAPTEQVLPYVGRELDSAFEFETAFATIDAINEGKRDKLAKQWKINLESYPQGQYSTFLSNHDQDRVMSRFGGGNGRAVGSGQEPLDKAKLAAVLLLTSPGIPFIYYGEEIGMVGVKPDEDIRTPMQWNGEMNAGFTKGARAWRAVNADARTKNVASEEHDPKSLLATYKSLIRLRKAHTSLRTGAMEILKTENPAVWAFGRRDEGETIVVVANLGSEGVGSVSVDLGGFALKGEEGTDLLAGGRVRAENANRLTISQGLRAREAMVLLFSQ